jgi:AcrR family transcriptional regulator
MTTPVKRPSGRDEVVEALLDAADRLFSTQGPADVSLRAIAREADVNHGMVHRFFGTRDDLVDRLLERMAERWEADVRATEDFTHAVDVILSTPDDAAASAGTWLRLLALSMLTDRPTPSADTQRRYGSALDVLPGLLDDRDANDAAITTASALALVFGWRLFHPYIRAVLHLDEGEFSEVHEAVREKLHGLVDD